MATKKVVVLDGCGAFDQDLAPILGELSAAIGRDGSDTQTFPLRSMKLAHCIGCFTCWLKTPGICAEDDDGRQITRAVAQSDTTVFFTPVTFGGYSPYLKKMLERLVPLISPYFKMDHGEVHHPPRYGHRPRLMMVGVQRVPNSHEAHIFRTIAGRNAINFHPPTFAAEVVVAADPADALRRRFEALLGRSDALPFGEAAASLMPPPVLPDAASETTGPRRALLIVGSPKTNSPSTSNVLGSYLLERLGESGWETESLTLRASLNRAEGEAALLESCDRAGLILLVFPLYGDALPYLATKALTVMATHRRTSSNLPKQRIAAVVNSGFPETYQNALALAICQQFAAESGIEWAGGLAMGGGGIIGGQPLNDAKRSGPPVKHVVRALDLTAEGLAQGRPVPAQAVELIAKNPIPIMPFALWRWIYIRFGGKGFEQEAAKNGISKDRLLEQPYAA